MEPLNLIKDKFSDVTTISEIDLSDDDCNVSLFVGVEKATGVLLWEWKTECACCGPAWVERTDLNPVTPEKLEEELKEALEGARMTGDEFMEKVRLVEVTLFIVKKLTEGKALPQ